MHSVSHKRSHRSKQINIHTPTYIYIYIHTSPHVPTSLSIRITTISAVACFSIAICLTLLPSSTTSVLVHASTDCNYFSPVMACYIFIFNLLFIFSQWPACYPFPPLPPPPPTHTNISMFLATCFGWAISITVFLYRTKR